ncbi:MAG TPA: hypothetical protein VHK91_02970 [Flavisolibacter sp.]|jgi:hypothetical protein|nr:hypothetical protein [Flavisolibacter sp.]
MKPIALLALLLGAALTSFSQRTIDVSRSDINVSGLLLTVGGEPFVNTKFVYLVSGTPYLKEDWAPATLYVHNGKAYPHIAVKLDLIDNAVHYQNSKGEEFLSVTLIDAILFEADSITLLHASAIPETKALPTGWYQPLLQDSVSLYKFYEKKVTESKPYNSATTEQRIATFDRYHIIQKGTPITIRKIKDVPGALPDKKAELEQYLKSNDDKSRPLDERMTALLRYYNSLIK